MRLKILAFLLFFLPVLTLQAQNKEDFGKLTKAEKEFIKYEKDTSAHAVILYEKGDIEFKVVRSRIQIVKKYHVKIKILSEQGFDEADITIPYYKNDDTSERIENIKAITHNASSKTFVSENKIFTTTLNDRWSEKSFTFSNVQKGSILEYTYTLTSPFIFKLDGWEFQSNIPKLHSEFNAKIPGNYVYNRTLVGNLTLSVNEASVEKDCFHVDGTNQDASCEVLAYVMKDIPAFKEEEDYMLAASNYISRLDFELSEHHTIRGGTNKYTKTWKDVDREFKTDKDIGKQLTKKGFFEKNVPEGLLTTGDPLTRAKNIYVFIQNHFTWNGRNSTYGKARVKNAFNAKKGNAWEINMSLINLLNAADLKANLMLSSTRQNGLPKKGHPIMSDFNYVLAKVEIDGKNYILDATDKFHPFGTLPFRTLNHYGRVMDFKNESYWQEIIPEKKNRSRVRAQIRFNLDDQKGLGRLNISQLGYDAIEKRIALDTYTEEEYLDEWEENFRVTKYELQEKQSTDLKVFEKFEFELDDILNEELVYFNPFIVDFFDTNPFTLEERIYPVDFGYSRQYTYDVQIFIPQGYSVQEFPKKEIVKLGEDMATLIFVTQQNTDSVQIRFDLNLNSSYLDPSNYDGLKKLFEHVTNIQNNSLLVLKKE